ncbi:phage portal protein [Paucibacter sp. DJ4R-1]|nr:phage portal protein [Paucibacter sp. DJ4R-1]
MGLTTETQARSRELTAARRTAHAVSGQQRSLLAALTTNDVASWQSDGLPLNEVLGANLPAIIARSRDASHNNPFAKRFLGLVRRNVLGPKGVRLQVRLRTDAGLKSGVNATLESAYQAWGRAGACDVTGRYTRLMLDRLALRHVIVDGTVFARFMPGRGTHGLQLQLLPIDVLAMHHRADLADGARIRLGVETDAFGAIRAYWFKGGADALDSLGLSRNLVRVPAAEVLQLSLPDEVLQLLGVPWMQAGLKPMHQAQDFASSGLNKARESAKRGGFFETDPDAAPPPPLHDGVDGEEGSATATPYQTLMDGTWDVLPANLKAKPFESDYPNIEYGQFIKDCLRNIASALEVSYISLGNDLSDVNYSSGQLGLGDERVLWQELQEWFVDHWCQPIYEQWLKYALVAASELQSLSFARLEVYANAASWQRQVWQPLDPLKTVEAQRSRLEARLTSPQRVMAENGDDPDDVLAEIAEWQAKVAAAGLPEPAAQTTAAAADANARRLHLITGGPAATGTE